MLDLYQTVWGNHLRDQYFCPANGYVLTDMHLHTSSFFFLIRPSLPLVYITFWQ